MKKTFIILLVLFALIFSASLLKDVLFTIYVEKAVRASTGLSIKIGGLRTAILKGRIDIKGLKIFNPRQFKDRVMLDLGHIYADYDLGALLKRNIHLHELDIDLKEFTVVKNKEGDLNLNSLKIVKYNKKPDDKSNAPEQGVFQLEIDTLRLKVGKVVYKDYTHGKEPNIREFNVNMDEKFTNIRNIHNLISVVMLKALRETNIGLLAGFNLKLLKGGIVSQGIVTAERAANRAFQDAKKLISLPFEAMKSEQKN